MRRIFVSFALATLILLSGCAQQPAVTFYLCQRQLPERFKTGHFVLNSQIEIGKSFTIWKQVAERLHAPPKDIETMAGSLKLEVGAAASVDDIRCWKLVARIAPTATYDPAVVFDTWLAVWGTYIAEHQLSVYTTEEYKANPPMDITLDGDGTTAPRIPYEQATGDKSKLIFFIKR